MPPIKTITPQQDRRNRIGQSVNHILKYKSGDPRRWREAIALRLNLNPVGTTGFTAQQEYHLIVQENKEMRGIQANDFAGLKDHKFDMRLSLHAPDWFMSWIEMFDKTAFKSDNPLAKKNTQKLMKEFPELTIPRKV